MTWDRPLRAACKRTAGSSVHHRWRRRFRRPRTYLTSRNDMTTTTNPTTNPNKALWEKGDFTQIAATMRSSGEDLVRRIGVAPGLAVLDLGCGDGTTAIPAAKEARTCAASISPQTSSPLARPAPSSSGSPTARSRRATPRTSTDSTTTPSTSSSPSSVPCRPAAVRHRRRDGARRQARRPHRDGQLDPR